MNGVASTEASTGKRQWAHSVVAVALVGFVSYLPLPLLAIGGALMGLEALARPLWILFNCLFPFLLLRHMSQTDGSGITDFPVAASVAQWAFLAVVNVVLVRAGVSKRPFLSALVLAGICAALSLAAVHAFDLRYQEVHT
jgi:hypothetical protein